MLWTKESNKKNALYVDAFSYKSSHTWDLEYYLQRNTVENAWCEKTDAISNEKRLEGNKLFAKGNFINALWMYNDSLSYAEQGSENISLAYANRSACFFRMKKYAKCLVDIELAENAGYPARLMPKLKKRQEDCLKLIEEGAQEPTDFIATLLGGADVDPPKLSFEPHERFPCMANILNIEKSANGKPIIVAKEDIEVGKIIAVEKSFAACSYAKSNWRCNICLKESANLMPCDRCNFVMFCSEECQASLVHKYECGLRFCKTAQENGVIMELLRMVFKAIEMFPDVDDLMKFVEEAIQSDPNEIPSAFLDERSKYRAFLKMPFYSATLTRDDIWFIIFCTHQRLMEIPKINTMFNSKKNNRFLIHLIIQHALVMDKNSNRMKVSCSGDKPCHKYTHMGLLVGYLEHSCAQNVLLVDHNGYSLYIMVRPVKKGEQLFSAMSNFVLDPKGKRQKFFRERANISCECTLCTGPSATPEQRKQLLTDPLYKDYLDDTRKCEAVLQKYGHGPLCDEMKNVLSTYIWRLKSQYQTERLNLRIWDEFDLEYRSPN